MAKALPGSGEGLGSLYLFPRKRVLSLPTSFFVCLLRHDEGKPGDEDRKRYTVSLRIAWVLMAYVTFYDLRGGGIETSLKGGKQGLGLTKRNKKRFEAQHMLVLLGSLAHNMVIWARNWLTSPHIQRCGILRLVRDVFHISGLLRFDASGSVIEIVLNQEACLARSFIRPLQALLVPLNVVVNLGET